MNDAPVRHKSHFTSFQWDDALRLDQQLSEEERAEHVSSEPFLNAWLRGKDTDAFKL